MGTKYDVAHRARWFDLNLNFTGCKHSICLFGWLPPPPKKTPSRHAQVPQGKVVSLTFRSLDLENDGLCRYDYVDVYDGFLNSQRLGRFCGTARPGALISSHNRMQVVMVSDANTAGNGFLAGYAAVRPNTRGNHTYDLLYERRWRYVNHSVRTRKGFGYFSVL